MKESKFKLFIFLLLIRAIFNTLFYYFEKVILRINQYHNNLIIKYHKK
tara:strand:+ start:103 stop:246 length:144 start_codon:yes stop_codon:yes gene_type:complete